MGSGGRVLVTSVRSAYSLRVALPTKRTSRCSNLWYVYKMLSTPHTLSAAVLHAARRRLWRKQGPYFSGHGLFLAQTRAQVELHTPANRHQDGPCPGAIVAFGAATVLLLPPAASALAAHNSTKAKFKEPARRPKNDDSSKAPTSPQLHAARRGVL